MSFYQSQASKKVKVNEIIMEIECGNVKPHLIIVISSLTSKKVVRLIAVEFQYLVLSTQDWKKKTF